jgi:hypothetical protein
MAKKPEDEDDTGYEEQMAEIGHFPYPDDLPVPRHMEYGPHDPAIARRFLNADYPLPGTFPEPSGRQSGAPAWVEYLENGELYPGIKLDENAALTRRSLVVDFAATDFTDVPLARRIMEMDRLTGFNPLFEFQYEVLNFSKWGQILIFELNGTKHTLHWHDILGWAIDQQYISEYPEESRDNFYLFNLVASSLEHPEQAYPVVNVRKRFLGDPNKILKDIPQGPLTDIQAGRFGVRRNPDTKLQQELDFLEEEFFEQPGYLQKKDLVKINKLRAQLGLPSVGSNLRPLVEDEDEDEEIEEVVIEEIDPHVEARKLYEAFIEREEMMRPHREYCAQLIRATASVGGRTPVMPLAIMGTKGGPLRCDTCNRQFPLEGGQWQGVLAGKAWNHPDRPADPWYMFISGHVTFLQEDNGTFRAYHGYIDRGCGGKASKEDEKQRAEHRKTTGPVPGHVRKELAAFLQEEHGVYDATERNILIQRILNGLFGYDPGIGVNQP